jgi:spoIIIJ-associated protein
MAIIKEVFTADTVEKAIDRAILVLALPKEKLNVEILQEPKKGFLGLGATPAKVEISYDDGKKAAPAPKPAPAPAPKAPPAPKAAPVKPAPAPKAETKPAPAPSAPREPREPREPRVSREPKTTLPSKPVSAAGAASAIIFLEKIIADTGLAASVAQVEGDGGGTFLEISGTEAGTLIGYHGETLEALQFLSGIIAARAEERAEDDAEFGRIYLDIEGYKAKREETVRRLARKTAEKALRLHKNIGLDPMPANERRIIHSELADEPGITTYSVGSDNNRRVIVAIDGGGRRE